MAEESGSRSWWQSAPGIMTAVAAVITALTGMVVALGQAGVFGGATDEPPLRPKAAKIINDTSRRDMSTLTAKRPKDTVAGFAEYFAGIPTDRIMTIEAGASEVEVIRPDQPREQTFGIRITEFDRPVAGLRLRFFETNDLFKVESIVDGQCRPFENYVNRSRGGDKRALQNWDELQLRLPGRSYELRLGYASRSIRASVR